LKSWALRLQPSSQYPIDLAERFFIECNNSECVNVRKQFELEIMGASSQYPIDLAHDDDGPAVTDSQ
jgi:hypothetical protein